MADKKISELTTLSTADATDTVPIVDVSANTTKKTPVSGLVAAILASIPAAAITAAMLGDSGWQTLTLVNGWTAGGGETPKYRKIGNVVYLRGSVVNASASTTFSVVGTLPSGYRPSETVRFPVTINSSVVATGTIDTAGGISLWSSATSSAFRGLNAGGGFLVD